MVKAVILISRQEGINPENVRRHFDEQPPPLVAQLPGLRCLAAMAAAFSSSGGQAVLADAGQVLDLSRLQILVAEEEIRGYLPRAPDGTVTNREGETLAVLVMSITQPPRA